MSVPRYWREIPRRTRLEAVRCSNCGTVFYPPRGRCSKCGSENLERYLLPEQGELVTFTVVRSPPKGFERSTPYVMGIIKLDDGTMVTSQITDIEPEEINIGMRVEAVFRKVVEDGDSGIIEYAIKFRPAMD